MLSSRLRTGNILGPIVLIYSGPLPTQWLGADHVDESMIGNHGGNNKVNINHIHPFKNWAFYGADITSESRPPNLTQTPQNMSIRGAMLIHAFPV